MKLFSIVCTRDPNGLHATRVKQALARLNQNNIEFVVEAPSIFEGYQQGAQRIIDTPAYNALPEDALLFHHEDIDFIHRTTVLAESLKQLENPQTGFLGIAGSTKLTKTAAWWSPEVNLDASRNYLRGRVYHQNQDGLFSNTYGDFDRVVTLDGVFLACTIKTFLKIDPFAKPNSFTGGWDCYDVMACYRACLAGLANYTIDLPILHFSHGETAGRTSWQQNIQAFAQLAAAHLPLEII